MNTKQCGKQSLRFLSPPSLLGYGNAVGHKEAEGPLSAYFDESCPDDFFGEDSWEKAESRMQEQAFSHALKAARLSPSAIDLIFAGDLLNQCIATAYQVRARNTPFFGLYGACSTMAESLLLGAMAVDGGFASHVVCMTSSHFCSAERQYRSPLEYGGQRSPTAQWTVTGSGALVLGSQGRGPYLTCATVGKIIDRGITDVSNMGAAMAPAAYSTLCAHFADTGKSPSDYDLIVTGDLGALGCEIVRDLFQKDGIKLSNYEDCGVLLFDLAAQDVHAGGSGCGCSAVVLTGYLLREMALGRFQDILFCGTGALHSPTSILQGESIPGICHALAITTKKGACLHA